MVEKLYQCCYTNIELNAGGKTRSGWQTVAASSDLPQMARNTCVDIQQGNSTIHGNVVDESGTPLNLLEIEADGTNICVVRSQFGLVDRVGRPNMFSHAYVFPFAETDALENPNVFLGLERSNFKDNLADAESMLSGELTRMPDLDIDQALAGAGMTQESYLALVRCCFLQMTDRAFNEPIHVAYDGTDEQMRCIMFCLYWGLPHYLRRKIKVASTTCNNIASKNVVFATSVAGKSLYVDPRTGENNMLDNRRLRKIARSGYADYAVEHLLDLDERAYFRCLDEEARNLGDTTASNPYVLKVAHQLIVGTDLKSITDSEVEDFLSNALRVGSLGNMHLDTYIANLLNEVTERGLVLTNEIEAGLAEKAAATSCADLSTALDKHVMWQFANASLPDAVNHLRAYEQDMNTMQHYMVLLTQMPGGEEIIDYYYATVILGHPNVNWDYMNQVLNAASSLSAYPYTQSRVVELAQALYAQQLEQNADAIKLYDDYTGVLKRVLTPDLMAQYDAHARTLYWNSVAQKGIQYENEDAYRYLNNNTELSSATLAICSFEKNVRDGDDGQILLATYVLQEEMSLCSEQMQESIFSEAIRLVESSSTVKDGQLTLWMRLILRTQGSEQCDMLLKIRDALHENDMDSLVHAAGAFARDAQKKGQLAEDMLKVIGDICCQFFIQVEQENDDCVIPLDSWLLVSSFQKPRNNFDVFDTYTTAHILDVDAEYVVTRSRRIMAPPTQKMGADYVKSKGYAYRQVKGWFTELNRIQKRQDKERKREAKRAAESARMGMGASANPNGPRADVQQGMRRGATQGTYPADQRGTYGDNRRGDYRDDPRGGYRDDRRESYPDNRQGDYRDGYRDDQRGEYWDDRRGSYRDDPRDVVRIDPRDPSRYDYRDDPRGGHSDDRRDGHRDNYREDRREAYPEGRGGAYQDGYRDDPRGGYRDDRQDGYRDDYRDDRREAYPDGRDGAYPDDYRDDSRGGYRGDSYDDYDDNQDVVQDVYDEGSIDAEDGRDQQPQEEDKGNGFREFLASIPLFKKK